MTTVHPRRPARRYGPDEDPAVAETEAVIEALSRRAPVPASKTSKTSKVSNAAKSSNAAKAPDAAIALLAALADDVDQRCSSVSITPST
ncbi:hypothetical protein ACLQ2R_23710 [Streptosporangium sp. DT93]|uniref:hypothetical protein n=1 Tax=Streptosporangium sp. DT93 TaxID=3393428 RepID=UPI003CEDC675